MSVGFEAWINRQGYQYTLWFKKNNLTFREALYETAKDVRARTNKTLVLPISGGADSMILYHVFKDLNIEVKTIHQRYWSREPYREQWTTPDGTEWNGWETSGLINEYESRYVDLDTVDIVQDIVVEDLRESEWFKKMWVEYCPIPWMGALQPYLTTALDKENDFIVSASNGTGPAHPNGVDYHNEWKFKHSGTTYCWGLFYEGFDYTGMFNDNATLAYSRYRSTPDELMVPNKEPFLEYHFPEIDILPKFRHGNMPVFRDFPEFRQEYGESRGYLFHNTYPYYGPPSDNKEAFFEYMDQGRPMTAVGDWNRNKCSEYGLENVKMLSNEIKYFSSSTIPSENL